MTVNTGSRDFQKLRPSAHPFLFISLRTRILIALLLTFFQYGVFYSLPYPISELLIVTAWIWAFPSWMGCLSLGFLPLVMNPSYGYFAFNLFCIFANLAVFRSIHRIRASRISVLVSAYKAARFCMVATVILCGLQIVSSPSIWMSIIPGIILPGGRGAGLRSEPSLLAGPLMVYLSFLVLRLRAAVSLGETCSSQKKMLLEASLLVISALAATLSISVLIAAMVFVPILLFRRRAMIAAVFASFCGITVTLAAFGERIRDAIETSSGSFQEMITIGMASWRNIPDILVLSHIDSYLWPGNPADIRAKLNGFAVALNPALGWLQNTYSIFSAAVTTLGFVITSAIFLVGLWIGIKFIVGASGAKAAWLLVYVVTWFIVPKYDVCAWVALGVLLVASRFLESEHSSSAPRVSYQWASLAGDMASLVPRIGAQ